MNKSIILILSLALFNPTTTLATSNDAILEVIYAAHKAGELAHFADTKYINLLEQQNEELLAQKYNYTGSLNRSPYWLAAYLGSLGIVGLGTGTLLKSAHIYLKALALDAGLNGPFGTVDFIINNERYFKDMAKSSELKIIGTLSCMFGILLLRSGMSAMDYVNNCEKNINHDRMINRNIEENQAIIDQLKAIQNNF